MDENGRECLIGHGQRGGLAVLDGKVDGRAVKLEALGRLGFHGVIIPLVQGEIHPALTACGDSIHQPAVYAPDLKLDIGDTLSPVALADLDKLQTARTLVDESECLPPDTALDFDTLGGGVQHYPLRDTELLSGNGNSRLQIGDDNTPIAVSGVLPIIGTNRLTAGIGHQESDPF